MRLIRTILTCAALTLAPVAAQASVTVLGFERINASYPSTNYADIQGFYGGGTSSQLTSGTNFGITFASNAVAVCLNALGGSCSNASAAGLSATSGQGALGIGSGGSTYLDFATAFTGAIAFRYQVAANSVASIAAYSGTGGTGTLLMAMPLSLFNTNAGGCPAYNAALCPVGPGGAGMVTGAMSIVFIGQAGKVVFDDLTLGAGNDPLSPPPYTATPEPAAWALMLLGFLAVGVGLRRRAGSRFLSRDFLQAPSA